MGDGGALGETAAAATGAGDRAALGRAGGREAAGGGRRADRAQPAGQARRQSRAPPLAGIDRRTRTQIARGTLDIDARLDLHGLTQSLAHQRLRRFLEEAHAHGARLVLVITGKGKPIDEIREGEERGVLRRAVPGWLSGMEFRHLVASFDEAGRRHGAGGALYVRLRRKR